MIRSLKIVITLIVISMILIAVGNIGYNYTSQENIEEKKGVLEKLSTNIPSIDMNDFDYNDMSFLDEALNDKRIVLLGEQTHSDGTTFEAKSMIIKYLHEKLGYNVVLYESGLYDMWRMELQEILYPESGVFYFWWNNEECRPLWDYFRNSKASENPVMLGGFDIQISGRIPVADRKQLIEDYLHGKFIDISNYPSFRIMLDRINGSFWWENNQLEESLYHSIQTELSLILSELQKTKEGIADEIYYRYLAGIKVYNELRWNYNPGDPIRMGVRDSLMADNLIWLADEVYKEDKIIIWAANIHIFNDGAHLPFKPMGAYIKERYGNGVYAMATTSYARKTRNGHLYDVASNKSIEYLLHLNKNRYAFINLNNTEGTFLEDDIISTVNQMMSLKNNWKRQFDGMLFIDAITPLNAK